MKKITVTTPRSFVPFVELARICYNALNAAGMASTANKLMEELTTSKNYFHAYDTIKKYCKIKYNSNDRS